MMPRKRNLIKFLLIFFGVFALCYWGTQLIIGLSAPGGRYSPFVVNYLDYVNLLRRCLMASTGFLLSLFDIKTYQQGDIILRGAAGGGIRLVYGCLAIGVMSFWIAFVAASARGWKLVVGWMLGGLASIFVLNVVRLSLVLAAAQKGWTFPLGLDHHGWFNIAAYCFLFLMIFIFEKSSGGVNRLRHFDKLSINSAPADNRSRTANRQPPTTNQQPAT